MGGHLSVDAHLKSVAGGVGSLKQSRILQDYVVLQLTYRIAGKFGEH